MCLGNICRSPSAHGVLQHYVDQNDLGDHFYIDSAGTYGAHAGESPDRRAIEAAEQRGYDLSQLIARKVSHDDFDQFDYILAMDKSNLSDLRRMATAKQYHKIKLFLSYSKRFDELEVPDPYYGGTQGFEQVLDMIEDATKGLLATIPISTVKQ